MKALGWIISATLLSAAQPLFAFQEKALQLTLNQQGLDVLAEEVSLRGVTDIENMPIDDQEADAYGIDIRVEGIRFSARLGGLKFTNADDVFPASVIINDAKLDVDRIKLKKRILGGTLRSTCKDTTVKVGHNGGEVIGVDMVLNVQDHNIDAQVRNVDFSISSDNYEVHGPQDCSGDLGTGSIIKGIVRIVLDRARGKVEEAVRNKIASMDRVIADKLNAATHKDMTFNIPESAVMQPKVLKFSSYPTELRLTKQALVFTLGLDVAKNKRVAPALVADQADGALIGVLGLNTDIMTDVLSAALSDQRGLIWLDDDRAPGLKEVLKQTSASSMWPDLTTRVLDSETLKLGVKLTSAPRFMRYPERQTIGLAVNGLELHFYIRQGGIDKPYAVLSVNLAGELKPSIQNGRFVLLVSSAPRLEVASRWGEGIAPDPDIFEDDVATVLLSGIFDYLYASSATFNYVLPELSFGEKAIYPSDLRVSDGFVDFMLNVK